MRGGRTIHFKIIGEPASSLPPRFYAYVLLTVDILKFEKKFGIIAIFKFKFI